MGLGLRGLLPIRALSSPGASWTPAGFSGRATSGGTRWASCTPASLGDSSESGRLFIGLLGTRILMPILDRSMLRRAEPHGGAGIGELAPPPERWPLRTGWLRPRAGPTCSAAAPAVEASSSVQGCRGAWWLGDLRVERSSRFSLWCSAC